MNFIIIIFVFIVAWYTSKLLNPKYDKDYSSSNPKCGIDYSSSINESDIDYSPSIPESSSDYLQSYIMENDPSIINIFFIGNPGVGKSFLCNLLGANFTSGISIGSGLTQKLQVFQIPIIINNETCRIIDAPGFLELYKNKTKENAEEIKKGLEKNGKYKIVFVMTVEAGRVRLQDYIMIERIINSIENQELLIENIGIIINKLNEEEFIILNDINKFLELYEHFKILHIPIKKENILLLRDYSNYELSKPVNRNNIYTYIVNDLLNNLVPTNIGPVQYIDPGTNTQAEIENAIKIYNEKFAEIYKEYEKIKAEQKQTQDNIEKQTRNDEITHNENINSKIEKLSKCFILFHTTHDDKDDDTYLKIEIKDNKGRIIAHKEGNFGRFDDKSKHTINLDIINISDKKSLEHVSLIVTIAPTGRDTWKFNMIPTLEFYDKSILTSTFNGITLSQNRKFSTFELHMTETLIECKVYFDIINDINNIKFELKGEYDTNIINDKLKNYKILFTKIEDKNYLDIKIKNKEDANKVIDFLKECKIFFDIYDADTYLKIEITDKNGRIIAHNRLTIERFDNNSKKYIDLKIYSSFLMKNLLNHGNMIITLIPKNTIINNIWKFNMNPQLKFDDGSSLKFNFNGIILNHNTKSLTYQW